MLVINQIFTVDVRKAFGMEHVAVSQFACIQAGLNEVLYVGEENGKTLIQTISSYKMREIFDEFLTNRKFIDKIFEGVEIEQTHAEEKILCKNCSRELPHDAKFCSSCGTKVEKQKDTCSNCGSKLAKDSKFCGKCGTAV